jgi:hypothetical protein
MAAAEVARLKAREKHRLVRGAPEARGR